MGFGATSRSKMRATFHVFVLQTSTVRRSVLNFQNPPFGTCPRKIESAEFFLAAICFSKNLAAVKVSQSVASFSTMTRALQFAQTLWLVSKSHRA